MSIFRFYLGLQLSFEHNIVRKNLFRDGPKNLILVETLVMVTRTWSSCFINSKYLHYMEYSMMLLEQ